ncbi:MAG: 50S ribosomal protein L17 [Clostridia bacterium]
MGYRKLGRRADHRRAMLRNLTTDFLRHERIETTETRAKELRKIAEKMITLGKRGDLHARRQAGSYLFDEEVVKKLFEEIAPRYNDVNGGYTRIIKGNQRRGDATPIAIIELV